MMNSHAMLLRDAGKAIAGKEYVEECVTDKLKVIMGWNGSDSEPLFWLEFCVQGFCEETHFYGRTPAFVDPKAAITFSSPMFDFVRNHSCQNFGGGVAIYPNCQRLPFGV